MESLFLQILNMSITATWIVLAVCLLRFILKKAPKWVSVALWGLVAFRLVCPFSFESVLSLLPTAQTIPSDIAMSRNPSVHTGISAFNSVINPVLQSSFTPVPATSVNPLQVVTFIAAVVWIIGMVGMLLYATVSFLRLRKKTKESVVLQGNVYLCDRIDTPFILGLFRPRIFLPSAMDKNDVSHVLAHENAHLARHDHWWKPLGFLLLTVHWFNPVLWLAYVLLCRDIELACDEKVIRNMDVQNKKDYSSALINCSVSRKSIAACPLAFGEVGVKNRIKTVLHYKKPTLWILIAAVILSCIAAFCLLTNPVNKDLGGYEYRVSRYYYDDVIGAYRANRELGEQTFEIDATLQTVRRIEGRMNNLFTFVPVEQPPEEVLKAVGSCLPFYYKALQAEKVYYREGWEFELRAEGELNYFIIQYSDGSLIGGYIGSHDTVPGEVYKLQRTQKLTDRSADVPADTIEYKERLSLDDVQSFIDAHKDDTPADDAGSLPHDSNIDIDRLQATNRFFKAVGYHPEAYETFVRNFALSSVSTRSNIKLLPVVQVTSQETLQKIVTTMSPYMNGLSDLQQQYDDAAFFENNVLVLCYYETAGVGSGLYVADIIRTQNALALMFGEAVTQMHQSPAAAFLAGIVLPKEAVDGVNYVSAQCNVQMFTYDTAIHEEAAATVAATQIVPFYTGAGDVVRELRAKPDRVRDSDTSLPVLQMQSVEEWQMFFDTAQGAFVAKMQRLTGNTTADAATQYGDEFVLQRDLFDAAFFEEYALYAVYLPGKWETQFSLLHAAQTGENRSVLSLYFAEYTKKYNTVQNYASLALVTIPVAQTAVFSDCEAYVVDTVFY